MSSIHETAYFLHSPLHLSRRNWRKSRVKQAQAAEVSVNARDTGHWHTQEEWKVIGATLVFPPKGTQIEYGRSTREGFVASLLHVGHTAIGVKLEHLAHWLKAELRAS